MLALAGYPLGIRCRVFDPAPDACAGQVAEHIIGNFNDQDALLRFAHGLDVVTLEWENVPVAAVEFLSGHVAVYPPAGALETAQDRLLEKSLFRKLSIPTASFAAVDTRADLDAAVRAVGLPAVLKTRRFGYDGKGHFGIHELAGVERAWEALGGVPLILEGFIPFDRELSVIAARSTWRAEAIPSPVPTRRGPGRSRVTRLPSAPTDREPQARAKRRGALAAAAVWDRVLPTAGQSGSAFYPLVENTHLDAILRLSRAPAPDLRHYVQSEAEDIAGRILDGLDYVGVLAVELFEHEGRLLANEIAPRVHNSGHWTIEGAETSQFENHLRAVCGLPLGRTTARGHAAMVNLIGWAPPVGRLLALPEVHVHMYGKEPRPGRKIGHVTVSGDEPAAIEASLSLIQRLIENQEG